MNCSLEELKPETQLVILQVDPKGVVASEFHRVVFKETKESSNNTILGFFEFPEYDNKRVVLWSTKGKNIRGLVTFTGGWSDDKSAEQKIVSKIIQRVIPFDENKPNGEGFYWPNGFILHETIKDAVDEYEWFLQVNLREWDLKLEIGKLNNIDEYEAAVKNYPEQIKTLRERFL